ncbi:MAG TPA: peptidoglycan glycosyltransferase, partial [Lachnospiraceae bacterium]|nr:peptidoglycan glycosyltransferase [Lachnospiraceae bacterium]
VGFSNDVGDGVTGIENYYNQTLTGTDGRQFGYLDSSSGVEQSTVEPDNGKTVQITLDMNIQQAVQDQIDAFDEEYGTEDSDGKGAKNVGVIVMDPNSGSILAMASNHEYDLSDPYGDYTQEEIKKMGNDAYVEALNKSWENFCVSQ